MELVKKKKKKRWEAACKVFRHVGCRKALPGYLEVPRDWLLTMAKGGGHKNFGKNLRKFLSDLGWVLDNGRSAKKQSRINCLWNGSTTQIFGGCWT